MSLAILWAMYFDVNVITYDYVGYGISRGSPTESKMYGDIECVLSFTVNHLNVPLNKIFLWGYSLGSGPTVDLASRYQNIAGTVLLAPLASCLLFCDGNLKWDDSLIEKDTFCNIAKIANIKSHCSIVHGQQDQKVGKAVIDSHH